MWRFWLFLGALSLFASELVLAQLAPIPESDRVLTQEEVKNYWINQIRNAPLGSRPLGLEPEKQKEWDSKVRGRKRQIAEIRGGGYDNQARLAQLKHNTVAWQRLGDSEKSGKAKQELMELEVHLAQLAKLKAEKKRAEEEARAAQASKEHMQRLESEISALRQQIANCMD